jgi:hypothetical protein
MGLSLSVWAGPLTQLGIEKKDTKTYRKAWDRVGPALLMRDAGDPFCIQAHLFIQQVWESGMKCRLRSHGSSRIGGGNSTAVACHYLLYVSMSCFPCKAVLLNLASPWRVHAYQPRGSLTQLCSCRGLSLLPQSPYLQGWTLLTSMPGPSFSAQRSLTQPCTCQSSFPVY